MHGLDDAGEKRLGHARPVVIAAHQQQILELIERHHDRNLQAEEDLHQYLEQREHEVLAAGTDLEVQLGEAVGEEVGQVGLIAEQGGAGETLVHVPAHQAGGVVRFGAVDVLENKVTGAVAFEVALGAQTAERGETARVAARPRQHVDHPLRAFLGLPSAEAELARPAAESGRGEQVKLLVARRGAQGALQKPAAEVFADVLQRPLAALFAAAQERVDHLKQQILEEIRVFLISARRDKQLPSAVGAMLDRVQQVRLARALVAEHGDHLRVRSRIVAIEVDDREELGALAGEQLRHVIAGADLVVGVAGKVIAERVADPPQGLGRALVQTRLIERGSHRDLLIARGDSHLGCRVRTSITDEYWRSK